MNDYTTKTASLLAAKIKGTKADITYLNIDGNPFSKVVTDHVPETPTDNDIWKYAVTTDDEGVVTVTDDVTVDLSEITTAQKNITKTAIKVIDNKVLGANDTLLMNWDTKNFTNENGSNMRSIFGGAWNNTAPITEWDSDLSNLTNGTDMFYETALQSFNGDLSSLTDGRYMFDSTPLQSFSGDLSSLTRGDYMFSGTALQSFNGDLSSLENGYSMFYNTPLQSFSGDLRSLNNGYYMFYYTALQSFSGDLPSLTNGWDMFYASTIESFNGDLSSLAVGYLMFAATALTEWDIELPNLVYGLKMFNNTPLKSWNKHIPNLESGESMFSFNTIQSFSGDLSSLIDGSHMFYQSALASFNGDLSSLVNGRGMFGQTDAGQIVTVYYHKIVDGKRNTTSTSVTSTGLKSFISNLSSLKCGYGMFGNTSGSCPPLDEDSIMLIADTINNISSLKKLDDSDWEYTYDCGESLNTYTIRSEYRGILHLGYDSSIKDKTNIFKYCDEIHAKGWTVYLNGSSTPYTPSNPAALIDGESSTTPTPYYYKPVQVTDEEIAEYVDGNGNLFIIIGAQHIFGDNISAYGMFTSYEHAVSEITSALGLSVYVKPTEEETTEE